MRDFPVNRDSSLRLDEISSSGHREMLSMGLRTEASV